MQTFFCEIIDDNSARLSEEETRHLKVLRLKESDAVRCIDGRGGSYTCRILRIGKDFTDLEILESVRISSQKTFRLHLYVAPTKNAERMEWLLEKAVEIGLDSLTFIECEHSEKHRVNMARMERIAISALKQSGNLTLPQITPLVKLQSISPMGKCLVAHCVPGNKSTLKELFMNSKPQGDIHVFIGPEGDFSTTEIKAFSDQGFLEISLGNSRLRTETAALYSVVSINALS